MSWTVVIGHLVAGLTIGACVGLSMTLKKWGVMMVLIFSAGAFAWLSLFGLGALIENLVGHTISYPLTVLVFVVGMAVGMIIELFLVEVINSLVKHLKRTNVTV
ncbi:MAG: hypothetical protein HY975_02765 [Candidatus Kerfeldbacteria bacterium]|nr:hypothetical protein [Candidatus Kerfeldbacteria bacterium]